MMQNISNSDTKKEVTTAVCEYNFEDYFLSFRSKIVGVDDTILTPYGEKRLIYADWISGGRLYWPIEHNMLHKVGPMVSNTEMDSTNTGQAIKKARTRAAKLIKAHIEATEDDVMLTTGAEIMGAVALMIRLLSLHILNEVDLRVKPPQNERPVVFITHMEHPLSRLLWHNSKAEVVTLEETVSSRISPESLENLLEPYENRPFKIGSFPACSSITGAENPYHRLAKVMRKYGGYSLIDFSAAVPYTDMQMNHERDSDKRLDMLFFSPQKFPSGPGNSGILIISRALYEFSLQNSGRSENSPSFTLKPSDRNHLYQKTTPDTLQIIRAAMCIRLKEKMGVHEIRNRIQYLLKLATDGLEPVERLYVLPSESLNTIGVLTFCTEHISYNLMVCLLNDRYGIQVNKGCFLPKVNGRAREGSKKEKVKTNGSEEPRNEMGWVRLSLHPTMSDFEVAFISSVVREIVEYIDILRKDYTYSPATKKYNHLNQQQYEQSTKGWFWV